MTRRKRRKLWSVPRISDPRFPGVSVRVTELDPGKNLYLVRMAGGRQRMASLGVRRADLGSTMVEQERQARVLAIEVIEELARGGTPSRKSRAADSPTPSDLKGKPITLDRLADEYETHALHGRSEGYRRDQPAKLRRISSFLGGDREVRSLNRSDIERFEVARKAEGARAGTVWSDIVALKIALNWATEHKGRNEIPILGSNPISKVSAKTEPSPRRPVADESYYHALKKVSPALPAQFEPILDLAWSTGHRITAVLKLQWRDVSFDASESAPHGTIRWRQEFDKVSNEHVVPINGIAHDALLRVREERPGISTAWIFPAPRDPGQPVDRHLATRWLGRAEKLAGVEHVPGSGWHSFRRAWATRRKHFPLADLAVAGGWRDSATLMRSYVRPDADTILDVVTG